MSRIDDIEAMERGDPPEDAEQLERFEEIENEGNFDVFDEDGELDDDAYE